MSSNTTAAEYEKTPCRYDSCVCTEILVIFLFSDCQLFKLRTDLADYFHQSGRKYATLTVDDHVEGFLRGEGILITPFIYQCIIHNENLVLHLFSSLNIPKYGNGTLFFLQCNVLNGFGIPSGTIDIYQYSRIQTSTDHNLHLIGSVSLLLQFFLPHVLPAHIFF